MDRCNFFFILICTNCITVLLQTPVSGKGADIVTDDDTSDLSMVHHDYQSMEKYLKEVHERCPNISRLYSIGKSVEGRELYVMEITNNPGKHDVNKPEVKYIGNIHGNEVVGKEMLLQLIKVLCTQYRIDRRITNIVNSIRLHILPSMNPDGYEKAHKLAKEHPHFDSALYSRRNSENADLNRNFPGLHHDCMSLFNREPETQAIMKWSAEIPFVLSLDMHCGSMAVIHPYGFKSERTPDDTVFQALSSSYFDNHQTMGTLVCGTKLCTNKDIMARAHDFYPDMMIMGDMQDYDYLCTNCLTISVEMNVMKYPKANKLADIWQENSQSLLAFMEMSRKGIHGFVHSSDGKPISHANITIEGNAKNILTAENGDYWRMMIPGDYNVTASHIGYESVTKFVHIPLVNESLSGTIIVNFTLARTLDSTWTSNHDFGLLSNLNKHYLNNTQLYRRFDELRNEYPNNFITSNEESQLYDNALTHRWQITGNMNIDEHDKFHIALIGGLYASQPIGREIILRLVTHLLAGKKNNDFEITNFLDKVVLHVIPGLDHGFENVENECSASAPNVIVNNLMNGNITGDEDLETRQFRRILAKASYDAVIFIVGGGIGTAYTTEFFEVFKNIAREYNRSMQKHNCGNTPISNKFGNFIYDEYKIPGMTLGLSCCNYPSAELIPIIWQDNLLPLRRLLFLLAHGVIIRVHDEEGNIIEDSQIHFSRNSWQKPFYSMAQKSEVIKIILPLGSVAIQVTHLESISSFVSEESDTGIFRTNVTVLNF